MSEIKFTELSTDELANKIFDKIKQYLDERLGKFEKEILSKKNSECLYMRPIEAEQKYGVSSKMLSELANRGKIKRYLVGTHSRYKSDEIESYLSRYEKNTP